MKVLLITGMLAKETVQNYASQSSVASDVLALPIAVAAFLTPKTIADALKTKKHAGYNMILVPGLVRGDTTQISQATGIPAFKGPRYAADLPVVLDMLCDVELSTVMPACELLREQLAQKALEEIQKTEASRDELLKKPGSMLIGDLAVGKDFPMRVLAELVDAPLMDDQTIQRTARRFVEAGAHIIDVGMVAGESRPNDASRIVGLVKQVVDVPVSIDTLDPAEINAAVGAGADLVLSADAGNIQDIAPYVSKVAVVVIPTNQRQGYFPKTAQERVKYLEEIMKTAKNLGVNRCIADLILEPQAILESFIAYKTFAQRNPEVPLFVGVSNVTELTDADSVGINATLARLSQEVDASILLATEKSPKAKGTVAEEVAAAKMMFLAKRRGSIPKDLGIDLLILKDKHNYEEPYNKNLESTAKVQLAPENPQPALLDPAGMFKIYIDRNEGLLVAMHFLPSDAAKPVYVVKGKTAESVYSKIVELGLMSKLDHAAYLGVELAKAEIALRIGKQYVQDDVLFEK